MTRLKYNFEVNEEEKLRRYKNRKDFLFLAFASRLLLFSLLYSLLYVPPAKSPS